MKTLRVLTMLMVCASCAEAQLLLKKQSVGSLNQPSGNVLVKYEDFSSAAAGNNPLSGITGWVDRELAVNTTNGSVTECYGGGAVYSCTYWTNGASSLNQRVELTLKTTGFNYLGTAGRVQTGAVSYYYAVSRPSAGTWTLEKRIASVSTVLASGSVGWTTNNKIALTVTGSGSATRLGIERFSGSAWTVLTNGVDPGSYLGTGKAGVFSYGTEPPGSTVRGDDWRWYDTP